METLAIFIYYLLTFIIMLAAANIIANIKLVDKFLNYIFNMEE